MYSFYCIVTFINSYLPSGLLQIISLKCQDFLNYTANHQYIFFGIVIMWSAKINMW